MSAGQRLESCRHIALVTTSEREAVAAQAEEVGVPIAGGFDARKELMRGIGAAVIAFGVMLMLRHRNTGLCGLANVQWRAIAAEVFGRRPFGQHGNRRWRVRSKFFHRVNNLSTDNSENRF